MNPLQTLIEQLNKISREILIELEKEEPSVELIRYEMKRREEYVNELGELTNEYPPYSLNDQDRSKLKAAIERFAELNRIMQRNLNKLKARQKESLEKVMTHRKALKGYNISKTPDISYF